MNHFDYRNGVLHAEAVNLIDLAEAVGTPFYCYSTATLERHYRVFTEAFAGEKARGVLRHEGEFQPVGAAHAGETRRRRRRGFGRRVEARAGRRHSAARRSCSRASARPKPNCARRSPPDILCINVESEPELELLSRLAVETGKTARISVRVNPDVDAGTHAKIATGKSENKFGVPLARARAVYARAAQTAGDRGHRHRHAYRQPDHRPEPDGNRVPHPVGIRADAARRRPHHLAYRFRRRPRHSLLHGPRGAAGARCLCRHGQARDA